MVVGAAILVYIYPYFWQILVPLTDERSFKIGIRLTPIKFIYNRLFQPRILKKHVLNGIQLAANDLVNNADKLLLATAPDFVDQEELAKIGKLFKTGLFAITGKIEIIRAILCHNNHFDVSGDFV